MTAIDPHRTLGLAPGASLAEIKRAYRRLAKQYHPDSAGAGALPRFLAIQTAYEALVSNGGRGGGRGGPGVRPAGAGWGTPAGSGASGAGSAPPWQADPSRARATRDAWRARTRRSAGSAGTSGESPGAESGAGTGAGSAAGTGAGSGTGGGAGPRSGAGAGSTRQTGGSRAGAEAGEDSTRGPSTGRRSPPRERRPPKATIGSTSYDGADREPSAPAWDGATWYGAGSGTYWTVNPKEYADPRKHGPEYLARSRRRATAAATGPPGEPAGPTGSTAPAEPGNAPDGPGVASPAPGVASPGPGVPSPGPGAASAGASSAPAGPATASAEPRAPSAEPRAPSAEPRASEGGPTARPTAGGPGSRPSGRSSGRSSPAPPGVSHGTSARPLDPERDRRFNARRDAREAPAGVSAAAQAIDPVPVAIRRAAATLPGRIGLAVFGWFPLALAVGAAADAVPACDGVSTVCADPLTGGIWLVHLVSIGLLVATPRLAWIAAIASASFLVVGFIATPALLVVGGPNSPEGTAAVLGVVLVGAWVAGIALALSGRIELPAWRSPRVR